MIKTIAATCLNCNEIFEKDKYSPRKSCSEKCRWELANKTVKLTRPRKVYVCLQCGVETYNPNFCTKSHAAAYNNTRKKPRSEESKELTRNSILNC